MKTLALVVGHGPQKDKGAQNQNGTTELAWNTDLANRMMKHFAGNNFVKPVMLMRQKEGHSPYELVNALKADFAIELHCNAFDRRASGTEMIHWKTSANGAALASKLQRVAVATLQLPDRGIKPPWAGRGGAFLGETNCPAVIVESFFIDNFGDLQRANEVKDQLAHAYVLALTEFAR